MYSEQSGSLFSVKVEKTPGFVLLLAPALFLFGIFLLSLTGNFFSLKLGSGFPAASSAAFIVRSAAWASLWLEVSFLVAHFVLPLVIGLTPISTVLEGLVEPWAFGEPS